jgi:hypothetical protein
VLLLFLDSNRRTYPVACVANRLVVEIQRESADLTSSRQYLTAAEYGILQPPFVVRKPVTIRSQTK